MMIFHSLPDTSMYFTVFWEICTGTALRSLNLTSDSCPKLLLPYISPLWSEALWLKCCPNVVAFYPFDQSVFLSLSFLEYISNRTTYQPIFAGLVYWPGWIISWYLAILRKSMSDYNCVCLVDNQNSLKSAWKEMYIF